MPNCIDVPYDVRTMEEAEALAAEKDCDVIRSTPCTLLCDYDSETEDKIEKFRDFLNTYYGPIQEETWQSSAGVPWRYHRVVTLSREVPIELRLAMQAALGSDPMRTFLDIRRVQEGVEEPCLLFRPKNPIPVLPKLPPDTGPF